MRGRSVSLPLDDVEELRALLELLAGWLECADDRLAGELDRFCGWATDLCELRGDLARLAHRLDEVLG